MPRHEGGCLCGEVRFAINADPRRINVCHCRFCQRNTGTAYLVEPTFPADIFEITSGTPKLFQLKSGGSGKTINLYFCSTCGARLYMTFDRFPGVIGGFAGAFDDPSKLGLSSDLVRHLFTEAVQDGTVLPAGVPLFHQHAIDLDGAPTTPKVLSEPLPAKG